MSFVGPSGSSHSARERRSFVTELTNPTNREVSELKDVVVSLAPMPEDNPEKTAEPGLHYKMEDPKAALPERKHIYRGTWVASAAHVMTAIIGPGVLGMSSAFAWLGWPTAIIVTCIFYAVTMWTSYMLTDVFEVKGIRHGSYRMAVKSVLGHKSYIILTILQLTNLILCAIGYTVAAGYSIRTIVNLTGHGGRGQPFTQTWQCCLLFGAVEIFMSQVPTLEQAWWASAIGAVTSVGYLLIAIGLGFAQADNMYGEPGGKWTGSSAEKVWGCFQSLGSIAFAYGVAGVLMEIQDTITEPPASKVSMKKSLNLGVGAAFAIYLACPTAGYISQGDDVTGNLLVGFKGGPRGVLIWANVLLMIHMLCAIQVFSQPIFAMWEKHLVEHTTFFATRDPMLMRLTFRTLFIGIISTIAAGLPFFNIIVSFVGAIIFWPLGVQLPILLYLKTNSPPIWRRNLMLVMSVFMFLICLCAVIGSLANLIKQCSSWRFFAT